jgi:hypothetical protein
LKKTSLKLEVWSGIYILVHIKHALKGNSRCLCQLCKFPRNKCCVNVFVNKRNKRNTKEASADRGGEAYLKGIESIVPPGTMPPAGVVISEMFIGTDLD